MTEPAPTSDTTPETTGGPAATPGTAGAARTFTEKEVADLLAAKETEMSDRAMRIAAEYQNFRRRTERERETLADEVLERFARDLLPALDSFERALAAKERDAAAALSGLELVERQLRTALEAHGMTRIDPAGAAFDPKDHEALFRTPTADHAAGTVMQVLEKGWRMRSRLLRPARVQVAAPKE